VSLISIVYKVYGKYINLNELFPNKKASVKTNAFVELYKTDVLEVF